VFQLGGFLKNYWEDPAVLKTLTLDIKAANVSLQAIKVNPLNSWVQGQILLPPQMAPQGPFH
jgi:hypothetical protein